MPSCMINESVNQIKKPQVNNIFMKWVMLFLDVAILSHFHVINSWNNENEFTQLQVQFMKARTSMDMLL